jgi:hypothetical protein
MKAGNRHSALFVAGFTRIEPTPYKAVPWLPLRLACILPGNAAGQVRHRVSNSFAHKVLGVFFQDAAILDDFEACFAGAPGGFCVLDAFLHPDHSSAFADGAFDNFRHKIGTAEDHDCIKGFRNIIE